MIEAATHSLEGDGQGIAFLVAFVCGDEQQKGGRGGRRKGGRLGSRTSPVAGPSIPGRCPGGQFAGRYVVGVLGTAPPFLAFRLVRS